ncbi:MAG TPA: type II toxin-antitoxin system RelE/ParE family toxin [Tepidisphaeraceae bacterium]|nr:type II toxin-antitoxin system RelE/ParE family toxin [Tepidisphaeraceae bacterium]
MVEYIQRDSPGNASRMAERIVVAINSLEIFPHRYGIARVPIAMRVTIRSMSVWPYLVRYEIDESRQTVNIISIRHGARRPGI